MTTPWLGQSKATTAPALAKAEREREAVSFKLLEWVVGEGNVPTYVLSMLNNLPGSEGKHKLFCPNRRARALSIKAMIPKI